MKAAKQAAQEAEEAERKAKLAEEEGLAAAWEEACLAAKKEQEEADRKAKEEAERIAQYEMTRHCFQSPAGALLSEQIATHQTNKARRGRSRERIQRKLLTR